MKVRDVMTDRNQLQCVTTVSFLPEVAKKMKEADTGVIPVVDEQDKDKILGLITDRDITIRAVAEGIDLAKAKVQDFMSKNLDCVTSDLDTTQAAKEMASRQIKRLCVVDNGKLVGMLALGDLAEFASEQGEKALEGISHGAKFEQKK
ncbi:MAG TPA: CBS domain-containing protein [Stenomitos sp.]